MKTIIIVNTEIFAIVVLSTANTIDKNSVTLEDSDDVSMIALVMYEYG